MASTCKESARKANDPRRAPEADGVTSWSMDLFGWDPDVLGVLMAPFTGTGLPGWTA